MSDMQTVFSDAPVTAKGSSSAKRWQCAFDRFEKALAERFSALREQDAAEQKEFRARKATNDIKLPAALIVEVVTELYFNNGVSEPLLRRSANTLELRDEKMILAYVKDDLILRDKLLSTFRRWQGLRRRRDVVAAKAKVASQATFEAASVALNFHDAMLSLLCTPSPSIAELRWKIEVLLSEDCGSDAEEKGWLYVKDELLRFVERRPRVNS